MIFWFHIFNYLLLLLLLLLFTLIVRVNYLNYWHIYFFNVFWKKSLFCSLYLIKIYKKIICNQVTSSQLHTHRTSNQPHPLLKLPSSPSVPSPRWKYPNFSSPAILQHVLLTQSPLTFSKQSLPHSYRHSHTLSTISPHWHLPTAFKQARVTPLLKNLH